MIFDIYNSVKIKMPVRYTVGKDNSLLNIMSKEKLNNSMIPELYWFND